MPRNDDNDTRDIFEKALDAAPQIGAGVGAVAGALVGRKLAKRAMNRASRHRPGSFEAGRDRIRRSGEAAGAMFVSPVVGAGYGAFGGKLTQDSVRGKRKK